jgi:hypothetical protein
MKCTLSGIALRATSTSMARTRSHEICRLHSVDDAVAPLLAEPKTSEHRSPILGWTQTRNHAHRQSVRGSIHSNCSTIRASHGRSPGSDRKRVTSGHWESFE